VENLTLVMESVLKQTIKPKVIVIVYDGPDVEELAETRFSLPVIAVKTRKHEPGMEQPRNLGARVATEWAAQEGIELSHVWFLDSDCIATVSAMAYYEQAAALAGPNVILVGPYDWLPPGQREPDPDLRNDPEGVPPPGRWGSFDTHEPGQVVREDLSAGLACFSGNLVWPVGEFERVGGFWNELHHGRCEDGELGLRAVAMGVGITFVRGARAWHLWHERNMEWVLRTNEIDVPKLNERHPWIEGRCKCGHEQHQHAEEETPVEKRRYHGPCVECECELFEKVLFVVEEDGKRFNVRCSCGWSGNTALIWNHELECPTGISLVPGS
jgi:GT2 family glycosyltransferase